MKENLFVFDIDDTLTKSEFQHQTAYVETMKYFGIKNINRNWVEYDHMTDSFILKKNYESNLSKSFSLDIVEDFEQRMTNVILGLPAVTEISGAKKAVHEISTHPDFGVCFATGSFLKPALLKLKQAAIPANPNLVVGSNNHYTREDIVQIAINSAKVFYQVSDFRNIISVGDGMWDLRTAQNLGIHFIGIGEKNKNDFYAQNIPVHIRDWGDFNLEMVFRKLNIL